MNLGDNVMGDEDGCRRIATLEGELSAARDALGRHMDGDSQRRVSVPRQLVAQRSGHRQCEADLWGAARTDGCGVYAVAAGPNTSDTGPTSPTPDTSNQLTVVDGRRRNLVGAAGS